MTRGGGSGGGLDPTPTGPFPTPSPRDLSPSITNRLAASSPVREITVHPAEGAVPVIYGGPLVVGGFPIFFKDRATDGSFYIDMAIGEGPVDSITDIKFGDHTAAFVGCTTEVHLGTLGDTGSTLINAFVDPTYAAPEYIARVVLKFRTPTQAQGPWNPFDFKCTVNGRVIYNPFTALDELNGSPIAVAWDALTNDRYSIGIPTTRLVAGDFAFEEQNCEAEVDTGIKQWDMALRIDTQDTLESWLKVILSYCAGHLRYNDGKYGVYMDEPRSPAQDSDAVFIMYDDTDEPPGTENLTTDVTWVQKGKDEIPTVVTVDYTDASAEFLAASVQVPAPADFDPANDWIESRFSMPGFQSIERARRMATLLYNLGQLDKDITLTCWQVGLLPLVGERFRVKSRKLIPFDVTPPNGDAAEGVEDVVADDIKIGDVPIIRCSLYRDASYGAAVDPSGPPDPPDDPPDPDDTPLCPTDLAAPNSDVSEYGQIEFAPPADDSIISYYAVYDIFTGSVLVGTVDKGAPIGGDGKYHASFPALVHTDPDDGGVHLAVRVDSVSYAGNPGDSCSTVSWDVEGGSGGACCFHESCRGWIDAPNISSGTYGWSAYSRPDSLTLVHNSTEFDATDGDFFALNTGAGAGILVPKVSGQYLVNATVGWPGHADSAYRALAFFYLRVEHGLHHAYITIDTPGSGYVTGEALTFTGGTLSTGGIAFSGTVNAPSGVITSLALTDGVGGIGYTAVPTVGVATAGGSGAVLTAHLPAAFTLAQLNPCCTNGTEQPVFGELSGEDIVPAVNASGVPTWQSLPLTISMRRGGGLLIGMQQGSGTSLNPLDNHTDCVAPEGCRFSVYRTGEIASLEGYTICLPPE